MLSDRYASTRGRVGCCNTYLRRTRKPLYGVIELFRLTRPSLLLASQSTQQGICSVHAALRRTEQAWDTCKTEHRPMKWASAWKALITDSKDITGHAAEISAPV